MSDPYSEAQETVQVVRHESKGIQFHVWKMCRNRIPTGCYNGAGRAWFHKPVVDFSE